MLTHGPMSRQRVVNSLPLCHGFMLLEVGLFFTFFLAFFEVGLTKFFSILLLIPRFIDTMTLESFPFRLYLFYQLSKKFFSAAVIKKYSCVLVQKD